MPKCTLLSADPVILDAVFIMAGPSMDSKFITDAKRYIQETYMHYKPLLVSKDASMLLNPKMAVQPGVTIYEGKEQVNKFINDISLHRHWDRDVNI